MLITMTAVGADGRQTSFEQRVEVPGHGFLDVPASLDRTGMLDCLRAHLARGRLQSAHSRARSFAIPALAVAVADRDATPRSTEFLVDGVRVSMATAP